MKKAWLLTLVLMLVSSGYPQNLSLKRGNEVIPLVQKSDSIWVAEFDGKTFFLLERSIIDSLTKKIEIQDAVIRHHEKVIAVQDTLLKRYGAYEQAADAHIEKQKEVLAVADSLQQGYKALYQDLKQLIGFSQLSVTVGAGYAGFPNDQHDFIGSLGIIYGRAMMNAFIGPDVRGVTMSARLPIHF